MGLLLILPRGRQARLVVRDLRQVSVADVRPTERVKAFSIQPRGARLAARDVRLSG